MLRRCGVVVRWGVFACEDEDEEPVRWGVFAVEGAGRDTVDEGDGRAAGVACGLTVEVEPCEDFELLFFLEELLLLELLLGLGRLTVRRALPLVAGRFNPRTACAEADCSWTICTAGIPSDSVNEKAKTFRVRAFMIFSRLVGSQLITPTWTPLHHEIFNL